MTTYNFLLARCLTAGSSLNAEFGRQLVETSAVRGYDPEGTAGIGSAAAHGFHVDVLRRGRLLHLAVRLILIVLFVGEFVGHVSGEKKMF